MEESAGDDAFVANYSPSELKIAGEFLTNWLPFLTKGLCDGCSQTLVSRIRSLDPGEEEKVVVASQFPREEKGVVTFRFPGEDEKEVAASLKGKVSWADELEEEEASKKKVELPRGERERIRVLNVGRKKDFVCLERVKGKVRNVLDGLELHTGVFSLAEQNRIVSFVYELQEKGKNGELGDRTYSAPTKWMPGKGRVTIQFGCCYNYAVDKEGNPPGILPKTVADPLPPLLKTIVKRLVRWHVLPPTCVPDSCIINIYEPGDCIPPHIDSHDFIRPFCTVSFLSECNIIFGSNLKIFGPGEFSGSAAIPLPMGSVLVIKGNGADLAKHCVPAVPAKRISITFRKMDEEKRPINFKQDPDLQDIEPLPYGADDVHKDVTDDEEDAVRKHVIDSRALGKLKDYVGGSPDLRPGSASQEEFVREIDTENSNRQSSAHVSRQYGRGSHDSWRSEGSSSRLRGNQPRSNSPSIPSPNDILRSESLERPHNTPAMRVVHMDEKRIIVRSNFEEEVPANFKLGSSPRAAPINMKQRRTRAGRKR